MTPTPILPVTQADDELIYQALRFYFWAAGEGISPIDTDAALEPEEGFWQYGLRTGDEDWETVAERYRDASVHRLASVEDGERLRALAKANNDLARRHERRVRTLEAAIRVARGWVITCSESAQARRDLATMDAALTGSVA